MSATDAIALYSPDNHGLALLTRCLRCVAWCVATTVWQDYEQRAQSSPCGVLLMAWLHEPSFDRLRAFAARHPDHAVILVTTRDADNARFLKDIRAHEVIWIGEARAALRAAVERVRAGWALERLAHRIAEATHLSPELRRALSFACHRDARITTVGELAAWIGCDRRTLWRHWRMAGLEASLSDIVDWLVLLRAIDRYAHAPSWRCVADDLHIDRQTLQRQARRLLGRTLGELAAGGVTHCADEFMARCALTRLPSTSAGPPACE